MTEPVEARIKRIAQEQRGFEVKDSGKRVSFSGGMVRDTNEGKTRYDLLFDGPMLKRWAEHLTKGANKYSPRNWMLAEGEEEAERFRESLIRHFFMYLENDPNDTEDHASAMMFNLNALELMKERLSK